MQEVLLRSRNSAELERDLSPQSPSPRFRTLISSPLGRLALMVIGGAALGLPTVQLWMRSRDQPRPQAAPASPSGMSTSEPGRVSSAVKQGLTTAAPPTAPANPSTNSQATRPWFMPSKGEENGPLESPAAPQRRPLATSLSTAGPPPSALKRMPATPSTPASPAGRWEHSTLVPPQTLLSPAAPSRTAPSAQPISPLAPPASMLVPAAPSVPTPAEGRPGSDPSNQSLATPSSPLFQVGIAAASAAGCVSSMTMQALLNPSVAQESPLASTSPPDSTWLPQPQQSDGAGHPDTLSPALISLLPSHDPCLPKQPAGAN